MKTRFKLIIIVIFVVIGQVNCKRWSKSDIEDLVSTVQGIQKLNEKFEERIADLTKEVTRLKSAVFPAKVAASCQQLADWGVTENGTHPIQPTSGRKPFEVECIFDGNIGKTIIKHNHKGYGQTSTSMTDDGCSPAGCFSGYSQHVHQLINYTI